MYSDVSLTAVYLHVYVFGGDWHFPEVRCSFIGPTERQALDMLWTFADGFDVAKFPIKVPCRKEFRKVDHL